ncbi:GNAT family N-acetyltransferase [Gordonia hydrophobica]|uniref:GNAT family N-acetyltransferase n=1 Tax=Gordonia hydrophobica TaxID=40516 RepID=A0ABZ2TZ09_9ACTN|nr:GNAT family N-acetyltransferase [Gordonia hydrophobica]MBM7367162.1 ElaA protein [Gordonia hydrophobica]
MIHTVHAATLSDLDPRTLHGLLRLRTDVFVVEQDCAYPEIDGRDAESTALHFWCADSDGVPIATLRVLVDAVGDSRQYRIGRVCVRREFRGAGLTGALMERAVAYIGRDVSVMDAQAHLVDMYARWGYLPDGPEFVEDGIPHVPLRRPNS